VLVLVLALALAASDVRWVDASVAHVRATAAPGSAERATLPIGVEVRVLRETGEAAEIEALDGTRGFVSLSALARRPPALEGQSAGRAAALAPSDLAVIERFAAAQTSAEQLYLARKGWVAAKRRSLMWDGPLYPIDDGRVRLPATCDSHEKKPTGPDGMEGGPADDATRAERRRAFRWGSSGKVVSLSERGYTTEHLRAPRCDGERLAYPTAAKRGALVPSWLVAGFTVTPVRGGAAASARHRVELSSRESLLTVRARTFSTSLEGTLELSRAAEPVAVFSEAPGAFTVLLRGPPCAERESTVFLVRASTADGGLKLDEGRPWGCGQTAFTQLDGEPRDVSREALLDAGWNR